MALNKEVSFMINTYFSTFFNFASQVVIIIRIHFCQQNKSPPTKNERQIGKENDVVFLAYISA